MKILQLCHKMPYPVLDGGAYSLYHTALGLAGQGADLKVFAVNTPKNRIDPQIIPDEFKKKTQFECALINTGINPWKAFVNLFGKQSYFVERFWSEAWNSRLISILKEEDYDVVHLEHIYLCLYIDTIRKHSAAKVVLRPQNVESMLWIKYLGNGIDPVKRLYLKIAAKRLLNFERLMAGKVDGIIALTGKEAGTFRKFAPGVPVISVPLGFDFNTTGRYDFQKQYVDFPVFYHLGSMDWAPNVQGVSWFINEVMPYVLNLCPEFVLRLAGKKMPERFIKRQSDHLLVDGEVKDSLAYHEDKAVMIVPLLSGGGIRVKIIEAMALKKTVISTTIGAEGIPTTNGKNILIADSKEEFAHYIVKCSESLGFCREIGENAGKLALENFDCNSTAHNMLQFYKRVRQM
ncbi:MAG: glycosyltransferase [Bacteroidales bacterium]|nr:glycosyltransferase [Bacteroidales bacterium]